MTDCYEFASTPLAPQPRMIELSLYTEEKLSEGGGCLQRGAD
jgi:hypothetical protein